MADEEMVHRLVHQILTARHAAIEEMCERMLTDPRGWGILVVTDYGSLDVVDGKVSVTASVELSPDVPFGEIHERVRYE